MQKNKNKKMKILQILQNLAIQFQSLVCRILDSFDKLPTEATVKSFNDFKKSTKRPRRNRRGKSKKRNNKKKSRKESKTSQYWKCEIEFFQVKNGRRRRIEKNKIKRF